MGGFRGDDRGEVCLSRLKIDSYPLMFGFLKVRGIGLNPINCAVVIYVIFGDDIGESFWDEWQNRYLLE